MESVVARVIVQVAAYGGAAAGILGTGALLALSGGVSAEAVLAVVGALTLVLVGAGLLVAGHRVDAYRRMASVLLLAGLVAWSVTVGVLLIGVLEMGQDGGSSAETASILIALLTAAAALALWLRMRASLQLIGLFVSLLVVIGTMIVSSSGPLPFQGPDPTTVAAVYWIFAVAWIALAARAITPRRTGLVLGAITAAVAPYVATAAVPVAVSGSSSIGPEVWAAATAVGVLALGAALGERAIEGLGIVAVIEAVRALVADHLTDRRGAAAAAVVVGVVLLGGALLAARRTSGERPAVAAVLPPPPGAPPA